MTLEDIDFSALLLFPTHLSWGAHNPHQIRYFYEGDGLIYKIWARRYDSSTIIVRNGKYERTVSRAGLAGMDVGLVTEEFCPALQDLIFDATGVCRGYIMRKGALIRSNDCVSLDFVNKFGRHSIKCGFAHSDFCHKNLIQIGETISLIDLDTPPSDLSSMVRDFEIEKGALRPHVHGAYRALIQSAL